MPGSGRGGLSHYSVDHQEENLGRLCAANNWVLLALAVGVRFSPCKCASAARRQRDASALFLFPAAMPPEHAALACGRSTDRTWSLLRRHAAR